MNSIERTRFSWNILRYSYGVVLLLAGLDKVFATNIIVVWSEYISPFVLNLLPVSVPAFLIAIGLVEVVVVVMLLTKYPRIAGYLSIAWLLLISVNLVLGGYLDIAIRDILLAVGAYVMAELTIVVEAQSSPATA